MVHRVVARSTNKNPKWYFTDESGPPPTPLPDADQIALEDLIAARGLEDRNYTALKSNEGDEGQATYFFGGGSGDDVNDLVKQILDR